MGEMAETFRKFAHRVSAATGSAWAFLAAVAIIVIWALTGPLFHFSQVWQLVINTGTTIITFLMVFLIQNTQNRDSQAIHLKLDELLRAVAGARDGMVDLEDLSDDDLKRLQQDFVRQREQADDVVALAEDKVAERQGAGRSTNGHR
jgi:low affinity Fe/Cu permease